MQISLIFNEIIKMNTVLICIFKLFFISFVSTATPAVPTYYCFISGQASISSSNYTFSEADLPDRCQVIVYGKYTFDFTGEPLHAIDEAVIKTLVNANRTVYLVFEYLTQGGWQELFDPQDPNIYDSRKSELVAVLKDLGLSGVVMDLQIDTLKTYGSKMNKIITDVKAEIPTIKFGIPVTGLFLVGMTDGPNFTITNGIVDLYIAILYADGYVFDYKCGDPSPPPPGQSITLKSMCTLFNASGIDMKKTAGGWEVGAITPDGCVPISAFCTSPADKCTENSLALYNNGLLIQTYFPWLYVGFLDFDDTIDTCGCGKFPASNWVIDGWEHKSATSCPKIDVK